MKTKLAQETDASVSLLIAVTIVIAVTFMFMIYVIIFVTVLPVYVLIAWSFYKVFSTIYEIWLFGEADD